MGKALSAREVEGTEGMEGEAGLIGPGGELVAVAEVGGPLKAVRPTKVLPASTEFLEPNPESGRT